MYSRVSGPDICSDGKDNDCDGHADCQDIDCVNDPACAIVECGNGICESGEDGKGPSTITSGVSIVNQMPVGTP